jgi:hypothetical protein
MHSVCIEIIKIQNRENFSDLTLGKKAIKFTIRGTVLSV